MTDRPLIVIPVRAGSEGLPGKHTRRLGGVPVLTRVLQTVRGVQAESVLSTNDPAVAALAEAKHIPVLHRPAELCAPDVPLDPVIHHAWLALGATHQIVAHVQATSPFLTWQTIERALKAVQTQGYDSATVVVDDRHLRWEGPLDVASRPARVNRQQMPPAWRETAAVSVTRARYLSVTKPRYGPRVKLIEVSGAEAVDLDTPEDWALAEWYAGVPSNREVLMARVLGDRGWYPKSPIAVFSGWDEPPQDVELRQIHVLNVAREDMAMIPLNGENTYAEAQHALDELQDEHLTLVTSAYHQVRAFLTLLRVLQERGRDRTTMLWNAPAPSRMEPLAQEWAKIVEYQAKGHVATVEQGLDYLDWRDAQVRATVPA